MSTTGSTSPVSQPLNEVQVQSLLKFTSETPEAKYVDDVVKLVLNTGLRRLEACNLLWDHVDLDNLRITIPGRKGSPARFIPIGPEVLTVLLNLQCDPNSKYVFGERREGLFRRVDHQLSTIAPKIGVRHLGLHTLRHTFFSRLVNYGAPVTIVMAIGGWKAISTTCKFFARIQPVQNDDAGMNQAI